jgi:Fe2+ or Zn2+ uptake regulation protein
MVGGDITHYKNKSLCNIEGEIWADIHGYEGLYLVSNMGRVKSINRTNEKILTQVFNKDKYLLVHLSKCGASKMILVHRAVGVAFLSNPENKPTINHKKGIKHDNRCAELEWSTDKENNQHSYRELGRRSGTYGKRGNECHSSKKVICINDDMIFNSATEAANHYGLGVSSVTTVCTGVQKSNRKKLSFKYV